MEDDEETESGSPKRYVHIDRVYTNSVSCTVDAGSSKAMSRKIRAKKFLERLQSEPSNVAETVPRPPVLYVYCRRNKRLRTSSGVCVKTSFFDSLMSRTRDAVEETDGLHPTDDCKKKGRSRGFKYELTNLGIDLKQFRDVGWSRKRERRERKARLGLNSLKNLWGVTSRYRIDVLKHSRTSSVKKWVQLSLENVDPNVLTGFKCKVFWPLDNDWYVGSVTQYDPEKGEHHIRYEDGDDEWTSLDREKIKFHLSKDEMRQKNLKCWDPERCLDYDDLIMLAASFYDNEELEHGDVIWAEIMGHAMWPALVMNEINAEGYERLQQSPGEKLVPVRFFGTYNYARVNRKQIVTLLRGILSSYHLKCQDSCFIEGLDETWRYLKEQKLPDKMLHSQSGNLIDDHGVVSVDDETSNLEENQLLDERNKNNEECCSPCPFEVGDLRVISLGKIVKDSDYFHSEHCIWPVGYSAVRKFTSVSDPSEISEYKMEILRNPQAKALPLFRVTLDNGQQINGSSPAACWKKIYCQVRKAGLNLCNGHVREAKKMRRRSGSYMFGFCNRKVRKLIEGMANASLCFPSKFVSQEHKDQRCSYQAVHINWKDLDRCNVCNMDEEYASNLFLQCDKCRMMVHARCYGESEPWAGKLWLCNLCRPDAPSPSPQCCLCPVVGGALKITTNGCWAHLTCAMWIPETCLVDVKKMEPIDGLNMIHKDRWKLLCSICGVPYGACIQCSNSSCRVAYHPLCARAADLCVELEDEENILHLLFADEDDDHCIRLLSFCKKHRQSSNKQLASDKQVYKALLQCPNYTPSTNCSGCARSEPYDFLSRRGRKEPEALAAASLKRLYVENRPYIVGGYCQNGTLEDASFCNILVPTCPIISCQWEKPRFLSLPEKYEYMKGTFRKRLVFGKSAIHGFGVFAKQALRAGDMVIEYTGELVRPIIADIRENLIYNSLVGAGTYMFRIDDKRVIDATRAGSLAHLINHSCEPNCYSRVISVSGDEHIIIFAKRDINQWEELTYDYRFFSIDQQLACYCGFPRCRGVVNDTEAEEQVSIIRVPRHELTDWKAE